jgi:hypothetical protein
MKLIIFYIIISIISIAIGVLLLLLADDKFKIKPPGFVAKFFSAYFGFQFIILPFNIFNTIFKDSNK